MSESQKQLKVKGCEGFLIEEGREILRKIQGRVRLTGKTGICLSVNYCHARTGGFGRHEISPERFVELAVKFGGLKTVKNWCRRKGCSFKAYATYDWRNGVFYNVLISWSKRNIRDGVDFIELFPSELCRW